MDDIYALWAAFEMDAMYAVYASLVVLGVLVLVLFRKTHVLHNAIAANTKDALRVATPELIRVWKREIKKHSPNTAEYRAYKSHLDRADK